MEVKDWFHFKMARSSKARSEGEAGTSYSYGHVNIREVEDYVQRLEEIFDKFKSEIKMTTVMHRPIQQVP